MKRLITLLAGLIALMPIAHAADVSVLGMRMWPAPDSSRIVFDLSAPVDYKVFRLDKPERVVIDFSNTTLKAALASPAQGDRYTRSVRHGARGERGLRIVLEVAPGLDVNSFLLPPNEQYGNRLVVDLVGKAPASTPAQPTVRRSTNDAPNAMRPIVIAIDAGHGGEDPGARGVSGVYEKDIVLAIARRLEALIARDPALRPVMVRDGDYFVSLRQRTQIARQHKADLFISIHADAFKDRRVRGSSLYVLSQGGASSEAARWLAERENASDLIGGVSLETRDDVLRSVLLDLTQTGTIESSFNAGESILRNMKPVGRVHKPTVQQAGFAVLKSPDIPSVLVETAFMSNPDDERMLRDPRHQQAIAEAIYRGIRDYFTRFPPPGAVFAAQRQHTISRGDTLSGLAQQYRVSVENLRSVNQLKSDVLRVGQVLQIPPG